MSQSFTFIDVAGNQAQYNVSEKDSNSGLSGGNERQVPKR